jgi:hypothetical protein
MSIILFCHGYTTKYVIMNGIKKHKKLIYTNNCMGNCKISKIGDIWIKSDFRLIKAAIFYKDNIRRIRGLLNTKNHLKIKKNINPIINAYQP